MKVSLLKMLGFWPQRWAVGQEGATQHLEAECLQGETGVAMKVSAVPEQGLNTACWSACWSWDLGWKIYMPAAAQDRSLPGSPPQQPLPGGRMGVGGGCRSSPPGESEEVHWSPGPAAYGEPVGVGVRLAGALAPELMPTALTWGLASLL